MAEDKDDVPRLSDEEWAEFERRFTEESAKSASYKEPSARQRELTSRWKKEPPKDTGWRTDGVGSDTRPRELFPPAAPAGPRHKPAWKRNLAWVLVALLVVGAAMGVPALFRSSKKPNDGGTRTNGQTSYVTPQASQSGDSVSAPVTDTGPDPADPFAGSPAEDWAAGANGIVLPTAAALGHYSQAQVLKLQTQVKQFLVAANLDPAVLAGGDPDAALAMIDPHIGSGAAGGGSLQSAMRAALGHPTGGVDPSGLFTRFKASETAFATPPVKVHGSMAASLDSEGQLQVKADYLFVYAVRPAGHPDEPTIRVIVRRLLTVTAYDPTKYAVTAGKLSISDYSSSAANVPCDDSDGFYHPAFLDDGGAGDTTVPSDSPSSSGLPQKGTIDPYDQSVPDKTGECASTTRT